MNKLKDPQWLRSLRSRFRAIKYDLQDYFQHFLTWIDSPAAYALFRLVCAVLCVSAVLCIWAVILSVLLFWGAV